MARRRTTARFRVLAGSAAAAVGTAVLGGGVALGLLEGYGIGAGIYQAVTIVTTLGYSGLPAPETLAGRFTLVATLLLGIVGLFGSAVALITEAAEMAATWSWRSPVRASDHHIVCGYGRIGRIVADRLRDRGVQVVVVDQDPQRVEDARGDGFDAVLGDAGDDETLRRAGIDRADALTATFRDDADNVFVVVSARGLRPELRTMATATSSANALKLERAGADRVVTTDRTAGLLLARAAEMPMAVDLLLGAMEAGEFLEVEIEEGSELAGRTLREVEETYAVNVLVCRRDGETTADPDPDVELRPGSTVLLHGRSTRVRELERAL